MTPGIRPLVAGNWKMNGTAASLAELRAIGHGFMSGLDAETDALICDAQRRNPAKLDFDVPQMRRRIGRDDADRRLPILL